MKNTKLILAACALTASASAFAERPNTYVFVNALYSDIGTDIKDESTVDPARTGTPATTTWSIDPSKPAFSEGDVSDSDTGFRIGAGLNFAGHWALEVSMSLYGEAIDTLNDDIEIATRARAFSVDVLRYFDLTDSFSLYGKAGLDAWTTDIRATQRGKQSDSDKDSNYLPSIAFGARYALAQNIDLTAELSYRLYTAEYTQFAQQFDPSVPPGSLDALNTKGRYETIDTDVELVTFALGAAYRF